MSNHTRIVLYIQTIRIVQAINPGTTKNNTESYFESLLYIKTNDNISQISKETYIDLVKAIYFDYYLFWYQPFMSNNEYIEYKKKVERVYQLVIQDVMNEMFCDISYVDCPLFHESGYIQPNTTLPVITRPQKKYLYKPNGSE